MFLFSLVTSIKYSYKIYFYDKMNTHIFIYLLNAFLKINNYGIHFNVTVFKRFLASIIYLNSFFLYYITPIGSWINSQIGGRKKTCDNFHKEIYNSLSHNEERGNINYKNKKYNIHYHFMGNS